MIRRQLKLAFARKKFKGSSTGVTYLPENPKEFSELMGACNRATFHGRVYARDSGLSVDFTTVHGCFGDERPLEGNRAFTLTKSGASPALPWDGTSMTSLPDDGTFNVSPTMNRAECAMVVTGTGSAEVEVWVTFEFNV